MPSQKGKRAKGQLQVYVSSQGSFERVNADHLGCHLQEVFYLCGIGRL
jgi:hypothetical protein